VTDIDAGQFSTLLHAYGRADDTAGHLAALIDGDAAGRRAALEHLWSAVIHQATPWTATPPAALAVAEILGALTDNEDLWDRGNGTIALVFREVGLPYDREACRRQAAEKGVHGDRRHPSGAIE